MNIYQKLLFSLLFLPSIAFSQEISLSSKTIPQELKEYANAVVRLDETTITIEAIDKMVVSERRIVTVLNKAGKNYVHAAKGYDKDTKITKLSAIVYNANGKQIKKYSKSKFEDVSAVSGGTLYSDDRVKYLDYTPTGYPYTIELISEIKTGTTGFINNWYPIEGSSTSTQTSIYKIQNPKNLVIRTKEKHFDKYPIENKSTKNSIHYVLKNQPAIRPESRAISQRDFLPTLMIGLNEFSLKGTKGKATNWKEFGKWRYDFLLNGKDSLPKEIQQTIKELVKNIPDTLDKAKRVYQYMQNKTRYISVQDGIGGWKPIKATEVDKLGYGDCKGLSNYTKALLDAVGIKSHYTIVYANDRRDIDKEFYSMQGNHIILNIPYKGNDIWLECTSQVMPFGFLGDFTDDRNVLVITPEGGVIKHTPVYKNETNSQKTTGSVQLDDGGNIKAQVVITTTGTQYSNHFRIGKYNKEEIDKYYTSNYWDYINNLKIDSYQFNNDKEDVTFKEELKVSIGNHGTLAGTDLLVGVNVFNKITNIPQKYRNRKLPLKIQRGFKDFDTITFSLPEGYHITTLPTIKKIETEFGLYEIEFEKIDASHFKYHRTYALKSGIYPKEIYSKYREFVKTVNKTDNLRVAFSKK